MGSRRTRDAAVGLAAAVACASIVMYAVQSSGTLADRSYLTAVAAILATAWTGAGRGGFTRVGVLVAAGVTISGIGDVIEVTAAVAGTDTEMGRLAWLTALAYFGGYLVLGAVIVELLAPHSDRRRVIRVDALLEAAALVTVGVLSLWTLATIDAGGESTTERAVQLAAPVADLILVIFTVRAIVVSRGRSAVSWLLAAGATTWLLTGAGFAAAGADAPAWLDAGWLLGMLLLALATVPREASVRDPGTAARHGVRDSSHTVMPLLLATVPLGVPPLINLLTHPDQRELYVPYVGMGVLLLITLLRVARLLASEGAARAEAARSRPSNAIKFTTSGEVVLSVRLDHPLTSAVAAVRFEVADTGIGIEEGQREHLFDAFTQADSSTTRRFGGTGLGLAICRQLITAMGGSIGVESRPGAGSTFWFSVPLPITVAQPVPPRQPHPVPATNSRPRPAPEALRPITPAAPAASRGRVLVVEDSEVNQLVAAGILEHLGYEAQVAQDGLEALEVLRREAFDAVLMDCLMPAMDGYEATAEIRRQGLGGPGLPVIAMTASAIAGDRERCLAAGMNDYVTKPATAEAIGAVLGRWLDRPVSDPPPAPARPSSSTSAP
jgi:CheY-like chemotaxis protein